MKKVALVIGVKEYAFLPSLWNTENDATDVADFLHSVGFITTLVLNPTQKELIQQISNFKKSVSDETISIIYFAGHGVQLEGNNFLVPKDAEITITEEIPYMCIHASDCLIKQSQTKSAHLLILDACRNNPFKSGIRAIDVGLAKMIAPMGTLIAFSTSPNSVSIERKEDRNGIYTRHLLRNSKVPNTPLERVFKNTRTEVIRDTNGKQVPWEESSLHGEDFYFIKEPTALFYLIKKELVFVYKSLTEDKFDYTSIKTDSLEEVQNPKRVKIPYSEAIVALKQQWEKFRNTIHPSVAFYIISNLQRILQAAYVFRMLARNINFDELNRIVVEHSSNMDDTQLKLFQKLLLSVEHFRSIFEFNDKFGNLSSIKRTYENGAWVGLSMKLDILGNQNLFIEDMKFIRENEFHLYQFLDSSVLIDIMNAVFRKELRTT